MTNPFLISEIKMVPRDSLWPVMENDQIYHPFDDDDPGIQALSKSIKERGILEPLLISEDHRIISGHRRYAAAGLAGLEAVPCQFYPIRYKESKDAFVRLLTEANRQRVKGLDEILREAVVQSDPEKSYKALCEHRLAAVRGVEGITIEGDTERSKISDAKKAFLDAVLKIIDDMSDYLPLSERQIHYRLLNDPPLIHSRKPNSVYCNDKRSYVALSDLCTRARLAGAIPMDVIEDTTRGTDIWRVFSNAQEFVQKELRELFRHYSLDLQRSQPRHLEIVVEKNTVLGIVRPIASRYCLPLTSARGFISLPPRAAIANRFEKSGRGKLILLVLSDFDPEGMEIALSLGRSMRDDFDIWNVELIRVAVTPEQLEELNLPASMEAKESSTRYTKFVEEYGPQVAELEALEPAVLQTLLDKAIRGAMDMSLFGQAVEQEKQDSAKLDEYHRQVRAVVGKITG
jgi:hypothetical protein